jgi:cytochrome c oxidase subunit 2
MIQASTGAQRADHIFLAILALAVFLLVAITGTMVFFVIRYSRKRHPKAEQIEGHAWLEIVWTLVPLTVFIGIFYYGWTNYEYMTNAPTDALVVKVTGRQWSWSFEYPNRKQTAVLYAPVDRPMKVEVRSLDVIHGFFIPAFRLKIDALPSKINTSWFQPVQTGSYDIQCTVICGVDHSSMLGKVVVVPEAEFRRWYFGGDDAPPPRPEAVAQHAAPAEPAELATLRRHRCLDCHSIDGRAGVGPTFRGLFGQRVTLVAGARHTTTVVDEAHLRDSIINPGAQRLKGYPNVMPRVKLAPEELDQMVTYIKNLK